MIVVDSSALIAVLFEEPEKQAFQQIIDGDERCILSAVNAHETACVLRGRHGAAAVARFWQWLIDNEIEIVAFDEVQVARRCRCIRPLWQGHRSEGRTQSCRLRGLCARRDDELSPPVQGQRLRGNRRESLSLILMASAWRSRAWRGRVS